MILAMEEFRLQLRKKFGGNPLVYGNPPYSDSGDTTPLCIYEEGGYTITITTYVGKEYGRIHGIHLVFSKSDFDADS